MSTRPIQPPTPAAPDHPAGAPWEFREAALFLRVSGRHLARLADAGKLRTISLGRRRLIADAEIMRLACQGC